jgi:hypothetical protein
MSPNELLYYRERAEVERQRATEAANPLAAEIHLELASLYERLVKLDEVPKPKLPIVESMAR